LFPKTEDETQRNEREKVIPKKEIPSGIVVRNILDGMFAVVPKDQSLGIIGSEGSGKTSAFSYLVGITLLQKHGTIYYDGLNILRDLEPAIRNQIGFIASFDWQDTDMTTMQLLMYVAKLRQLPKVERLDACNSVLDQLGSIDLAKRRLNSLNTKERRIVDIATAQLHRPMYIIMDEPTRGCLCEDREHIWRLLQRMMVGRICILFTESIEECRFLTTRMAFVANGRIHAIGTHMELKEHFGMGYVLSVVLTSLRRKSAFLGYISGIFPAAIYLPSGSEQQNSAKEDTIPHIELQFSVERGATSQIGPFLLDLETRMQEFGLVTFTVRQLHFYEVLDNIQKMATVVKLKREKQRRRLERKKFTHGRRKLLIRRNQRY
jgi:ABC-type multidrug transport system ATPase subunit